MATEIEHKYIVTSDEYRTGSIEQQRYIQGYLTTSKECVVRVRIAGERAVLTIKGENRGASRQEYEVDITIDMAQSMLHHMSITPIIDKTRYIYPYRGHRWEIDCFHGDNEGLVIAEIELQSEDVEYELPPFVGKNVTGIARYYNSNLAQRPFKQWSIEEQCGVD
ncbi:MAG: CYTH domain-containing protein [Bacteroidaceae bacterium]|nr:CYTH domain-containing protein [Bacteroidaceae bacterium]